LNDTLLPLSNQLYKSLYTKIIHKKPTVTIEEQVFTKIGKKEIYVHKLDNKKNLMKGIYIYEKIKNEKGERIYRYIFAEEGYWKKSHQNLEREKTLILRKGTIHQTLEKEEEKYHIMKFNTHDIVFEFKEKESLIPRYGKSLREMTSKELKAKIKEYQKRNLNTNILLIELYKKISIPFACIIFTLIGTPLGLLAKKSGKSIGLGLSILIIFLYYLFLICGETLGNKGIITPFLAMWLPNLILGSLGVTLCFLAIKH
jgi:lipopolysaccharide export LptBFGC system permease protein LptF